MSFGHCVWMPPSPTAALVALTVLRARHQRRALQLPQECLLSAVQYVFAGKTLLEDSKKLLSLKACFGSYEVPPEKEITRGSEPTPLRTHRPRPASRRRVSVSA